MAIIPLPPKFSFTRIERFALARHGNILRSRFTGQAQRVVYPFAVWEIEGTLVEYDGPEAAAIRSFLMQLEGFKNTFRLPVPGYIKPSTGYDKNPLSRFNADARVSSISVDAKANNTNVVSEGDFITIQDELKIVTASASSDAEGNLVINFKPALRKSVAAGTTVYVQNPWCLMHAVDSDVANWSLSAPVRHGVDFRAIEAVEI